ncbi:MAG TPA: hypothetical protein VGE85_02170 [Terracidiphilus sp.]|jgi:hypothetical protein
MKRRLVYCIVGIVFVVLLASVLTIASMIKNFYNGFYYEGGNDAASSSMEVSRNNKVFITEAQINPKQISHDGVSVDFDSAWIERKSITTPYYIWFHRTSILTGYFLVMRCKNGRDVLNHGDYFLQREDKGHSFAAHGTAIFDEDLDDADYRKGGTIIFLVKDWKEPRNNPMVVTWPVSTSGGVGNH